MNFLDFCGIPISGSAHMGKSNDDVGFLGDDLPLQWEFVRIRVVKTAGTVICRGDHMNLNKVGII